MKKNPMMMRSLNQIIRKIKIFHNYTKELIKLIQKQAILILVFLLASKKIKVSDYLARDRNI
jgi:hypothetical protein